MTYDTGYLLRLIETTNLLDHQENLELGLQEIALQTSTLLKTASCSIMLVQIEKDKAESPSLHLFAHVGDLPEEAYKQSQKFNQGIAGKVAASGKPLLVADITKSKFIKESRQTNATGSFISAPIFLNGKVIGVININNPLDGRQFDEPELQLLTVFAQFVGKSIHLIQLQNLLKSSYLQKTMIAELRKNESQSTGAIAPDPVKLEKIVAKSFFRELNNAGFGANAIIGIATEIISLLSQRLEKHRRRMN